MDRQVGQAAHARQELVKLGEQADRGGLEKNMTIELNNNVYADGGNDTETTPVVLVHGFPVDHRMWDECATALRDQAVKQGVKPFAIWAPDMPGAGEGPIPSDEDSGGKDADGAFPYGLDRMADAYVGLLHAAGYGKAIWVGLSMGGYLILDIQRLHPEAVAALALCDTKADADSADMRLKRVAIATDCETTGTHEPVMGFAVPSEADSTVKRVGRLLQAVRNVDQRTARRRHRLARTHGRWPSRPERRAAEHQRASRSNLRRQGPVQPAGSDEAGRRRDDENRRDDDGDRRLRPLQRVRTPRPGGRRVTGTGEASRLSRLRRLSVADHPAYRQDIEKIYKTYIRNMYCVCITNIFRI